MKKYNNYILKSVLLYLIMLWVHNSMAQTNTTSDTVKQMLELPNKTTQDSIIPSTVTTVDTSHLPEPTKPIVTQPDTSPNKVKQIPKFPNKTARKGVIATKKVDSVYQVAMPFVTHSSVTIDAGQVFSTFKFIDSEGDKAPDYKYNITSAYSLGYQHTKNNGLFYRANIGMRHGGASLIKNGIEYNWNFQYADAAIGAGYMLNRWRIKPYFFAAPYLGYLLKANQTIGMSRYDIKQNTTIKTADLGLFLCPGAKLAISNLITIYAEYKYILGLQNLEKSTTQKSYNRGFLFNLGLSFNITKYQ